MIFSASLQRKQSFVKNRRKAPGIQMFFEGFVKRSEDGMMITRQQDREKTQMEKKEKRCI